MAAAALSVSHKILRSTGRFAWFTGIIIARDAVQQVAVQNEHVASKNWPDVMDTKVMTNTTLS